MADAHRNTVLEFVDWLAGDTGKTSSIPELFSEFNTFLNQHHYEIFRANFASRSLHPQFGAVSLIWSERNDIPLPPAGSGILERRQMAVGKGFVTLLRIQRVNIETQAFRDSPFFPVLTRGETVRERIAAGAAEFRFPIIKDLGELGGTDYLAMPVHFKGQIEGFFSFATRQGGGYSEKQLAELARMARLFSVALEARLRDDLLDTLLRLYLGEITGPQVLKGRIQRGDMESFESAVWFSDIRGFSALTSISTPQEIIELLNTYYETIIPVVRRYGGEVLKFLGDGLLVIFGGREGKERQARYQSLLAANAAGKALQRLNEQRIAEEKIPLEHGIGLHYGRIEYGNIGSDERLDFTAVGAAVNTASRVAALCADLGQSVLISGDLAQLLRVRLTPQGIKELKGIPRPVAIFALPPKLAI